MGSDSYWFDQRVDDAHMAAMEDRMEHESEVAAKNTDGVAEAIAAEQTRVIQAAMKFGDERGYCGMVVNALAAVFPHIAKTDFRDAEGFNWYGVDAEGYTRGGWNINTGLNRAGEKHSSWRNGAQWCESCQMFE